MRFSSLPGLKHSSSRNRRAQTPQNVPQILKRPIKEPILQRAHGRQPRWKQNPKSRKNTKTHLVQRDPKRKDSEQGTSEIHGPTIKELRLQKPKFEKELVRSPIGKRGVQRSFLNITDDSFQYENRENQNENEDYDEFDKIE